MVPISTKEELTNNDTTNLLNNGLGLLLNKLQGDESAETVVKETFAKVERAKREWESTVDALPELICIIADNVRVDRSNRTVEKWELSNVKRVIGTNYHDLVHPHCCQPCYLSNAIHQSVNHLNIIEQETFDENLQRYISARVQPVSMRKGSLNGNNHFVVILKDISVRKQAEQALQRQNGRLLILNAINKAILAADSPTAIAMAALKHIQTLVPYQHAHLLIKTPETDQLKILAVITNGAETSLEAGQITAKQIIFEGKKRILSKFYIIHAISRLAEPTEMEKQWLEQALNCYMNVPLKTGSYDIGVLQLATNNPAVFESEQIEAIQEIAETLTIAIQQSQLHQKLERTNDELQRILRTKHEILQDVSHDLRSPLALIKGYAELLRDGLLGNLTQEQINVLNIIDRKGEQLLVLVNRIFQSQTVGKDTLDKKPLNLNLHLQETTQSWQVLTANKNIRLQLMVKSKLPIIMADANLIDQVLTNLLDNALKFSPEDSTITISAEPLENEIMLTIADQGQGIDPEKVSKIFERFYQVKSSGQAKAGAGIGLALCKAIVDAHDGRIWANSAGNNQGTTFYITLPITKINSLSPQT